MIELLLLIIFCTLLPTIHYGDIVDEQFQPHHHNKKFKKNIFRHWRWNFEVLKWKLYGAYMFKDRSMDRFSIIVMHIFTVGLIYWVMGITTAMLWGVCPSIIWVAVWRNGRRYQFSNIVTLIIYGFPPWGMACYPLVGLFQISALPAFMLYLLSDYWWLSVAMAVFGIIVFFQFKEIFDSRRKKKPRLLVRIGKFKLVLMTRTLAFYTFKFLVPQREFMYHDFMQNYGTDIRETRECFKKDIWFYSGLLIFIVLIAGICYQQTRVGCLWYLLFMFQYSNIITLHQQINTRYAILPAIGLYYAVASLLPIYVCVMLAATNYFYLVLSMKQCVDNENLYNYHFTFQSRALAPYIIVAKNFIERGMYDDAMRILGIGNYHVPDAYSILHLMALCNPPNCKEVIARMWEILPYQTFLDKEKIREMLISLEKKVKA